jgi:very-short-patch-repair endonuclease
MLKYNPSLKKYSRKLRREATDAEKILWSKLRRGQINNLRFTRQKPIGKYIVDFYCHKLKLIIELDGDQHYYEEGKVSDKQRDEFLRSQGLQALKSQPGI